MIQVTDDLKPMVSDYKMNLLQIRSSEHFHFQNNDVQTVFDMVRLIYEEDYTNFNKRYKDKSISTELVYCLIDISSNNLPVFPSNCVDFAHRCHRIASFSHLVDEKTFYVIWLKVNETVH